MRLTPEQITIIAADLTFKIANTLDFNRLFSNSRDELKTTSKAHLAMDKINKLLIQELSNLIF